jgi:RNA polymerase sigma-70 factor (ECF subfamily)
MVRDGADVRAARRGDTNDGGTRVTGTRAGGGREAILALLPQLRGYARSLTGGDEHAADDLVQDTVVQALQAWDRFTPGTNLKAWLFRILHNRHLTVRERRHVTAEIGVDDLSLHGSVPAFQEGRAELRHFKAAFARLNPSQREVLVLHAVHGLPYEQIAEVTGCKVQAVKSRMNRARTALRRMLLGDDAPEGTADPARERQRAVPARGAVTADDGRAEAGGLSRPRGR